MSGTSSHPFLKPERKVLDDVSRLKSSCRGYQFDSVRDIYSRVAKASQDRCENVHRAYVLSLATVLGQVTKDFTDARIHDVYR